MRVDVITIFPDLFPGPLGESITGRAMDSGLLELLAHDLRDFADGSHRQVDDEPFGGGGGMVLKPEPLFAAVEHVHAELDEAGIDRGPVVLLSPQGERLEHPRAEALAAAAQLTFLCGRYEGIDERVREHLVDLELSIGDYVVTGGELPAMIVIDAITRLQEGALGDAGAARRDSFSEGLLDYPQYTRPAEYRAYTVPEILRSGNHQAIAEWRREQALLATARKRPDLLENRSLSDQERALLEKARQCPGATGSGSTQTLEEREVHEHDQEPPAAVTAGDVTLE